MNEEPNGTSGASTSQARPRYFGKYLLLEKIGAGGMAEIFKAVVRGAGDFQKVVVIKRILLGYSRDPSFVKMFVDEARITAPLQHANIVGIYEFDQVDGQYYLAMEMVHGRDLQRVMARANKVGRTMPAELAVYITGEVCKALWYAYNARDARGNALQIIHRDVSPSNVLVSFDGEVKVTDFGVAKAATSTGGDQGAGVLKGKLGYMSPEQVLGKEVDHRSDIFGLGVILFECLTLKRMFLGRTDLQTLINVRDADVEKRLSRHPEIEAGLADILRKALAKDRERRYRNAQAFQEELQDWLYGKGHRIGSQQMSVFVRDLFPEEAEQELLPLEVEEVTEGGRRIATSQAAAQASAQAAAQSEASTARRPSTPVPVPPVAVPAVDVEAAPVRRPPTGPVAAPTSALESPTAHRVSQPLPLVSPPTPRPSVAMTAESTSGMLDPESSGLQARPQDTRNTRVTPGSASFRLRDADGNVFGPVSFDNVLSLLKSRSITEDEECQLNDGEWMHVSEVAAFRGHLRDASIEVSRRVLLFENAIDRRNLVRLMAQIGRRQRLSGLLTFKQGSHQKEVYFKDGRARFIYSNLKNELLGEFLVRRSVASRENVDGALVQSRTAAGRLGDTLVSQGIVGAHELAGMLQDQFRERFLELFRWEGGWFGFFENVQVPSGVVTMELDPLEAAAEAVRIHYPLPLLRAFLADAAPRRLVRADSARVSVSDLKLLPREMRVVNLLDQNPSIAALQKVLPQTPEAELLIYRVIYLLTETGTWLFRGAQAAAQRR